ncbi:TetR family transcriptional regulator [Novosphingobium sp. BL-52-GroH]|uniref:TetR family transcriptional regulator n=1 Tax=Novosphingobium sp. BL-52-GroH TaxID=3349877 RepID=UPI003850E4A3
MASRKKEASERRSHRSGVRTRLSILRAAEAVIAERGYESASLREITSRAGVDLALVNYHFGSKERLYIAILSRRNLAINRKRLKRLEQARRDAAPHAIPPEVIVDCFLDPIFERLMAKATGWRDWGRIAARINSTPPVLTHQREEVDEISLVFIRELQRSLAHVDPGSLYFRYAFMAACVIEVLHSTSRVSNMSEGAVDMRDIARAAVEARAFIIGALTAPGADR